MTTAIAYTSGKPHIGNAYEIVLADAIARYKRSQGYDVFFQTGTDEHGQKIELKASGSRNHTEGICETVLRERLGESGVPEWIPLMINLSVQQMNTMRNRYEDFKKLYGKEGDIYKGCYEGMYCTPQVFLHGISACGRKIPGLWTMR